MRSIAAASSGSGIGIWAYLAVFAATAGGYMGIPIIGTAAIGAAAVLASQGQLNIAAVLIVAAIGNEVGGLLGYQFGDRWGWQLLEHPGPALKMRKNAVAKGGGNLQESGDAPPCSSRLHWCRAPWT
jgi:membrane protein DedA with SNARE-associated domain